MMKNPKFENKWTLSKEIFQFKFPIAQSPSSFNSKVITDQAQISDSSQDNMIMNLFGYLQMAIDHK
jgi:hypothetical protein